jgi:hypothetical protein
MIVKLLHHEPECEASLAKCRIHADPLHGYPIAEDLLTSEVRRYCPHFTLANKFVLVEELQPPFTDFPVIGEDAVNHFVRRAGRLDRDCVRAPYKDYPII